MYRNTENRGEFEPKNPSYGFMTARPRIFLSFRSHSAAFASSREYFLDMIGLIEPFFASFTSSFISSKFPVYAPCMVMDFSGIVTREISIEPPKSPTRTRLPLLRKTARPIFAVGGAFTKSITLSAPSPPKSIGVFRDGGYAQEVMVPHPKYLTSIDGVNPEEATSLACSGLTAYTAVKKANVSAPRYLVIIGAGGLGLMGVQVAKAVTDAKCKNNLCRPR